MKAFFIIVFSVFLSVNTYIFIRIWQAIPSVFICRLIFTVTFILVSALFFVAMLSRNVLPLAPLKIIYAIGITWVACMIYFFLFFLITDIIDLLNHRFHFLPESISLYFRQIQVYGASVVIAIILIAGYYKFNHPSTNIYNIHINKKAGEKKELRIVGLSDIHLGLLINKERLSKYVDKINALKPDIILIAGDVVDNSVRPLNEWKLDEEINRLDAPLGIYMCLGNHEHISGINNSLDFLKKTKINLLLDDVVLVDKRFWIVGRDDKSIKSRKTLESLLMETDKSNPIFLLDHQPFHLDDAEKNGVDFQFSGHTHNGQFWPGNYIVRRVYELGHGYKQKGDLHVYVSSGLALWGPLFRVGTESEIAVFDVKFD